LLEKIVGLKGCQGMGQDIEIGAIIGKKQFKGMNHGKGLK
jgi:hypothetical protein